MATRKLTAPTKRPIRLPPVRPNPGLTEAYQARIDRLIGLMHRDVDRQVRRQRRLNPPELASDGHYDPAWELPYFSRWRTAEKDEPAVWEGMVPLTDAENLGVRVYLIQVQDTLAMDESPAAGLRRLMARLSRKWLSRFDTFAQRWSKRFTVDAVRGADRSFSAALRKAGFTVRFQMTREANDVMQATIAEQVGLIKSIPAQYLLDVQGAVMRSVQVGGPLHDLTNELETKYGITRRRAALIARSQNNIATASITRVRQQEVGITEAIWLHSAGGRVPRPTHVANTGKPYKVAEGWFDPHEKKRIWPGQLINCRCVSKAIIPGL